MSASGRRAALKVAIRNAARNRKRTFFLVALVAVPVALAVVVAGLVRASNFTIEEQVEMEFGRSEVSVRAFSNSDEVSGEVIGWASRMLGELAPEAAILSYRQAFLSFEGDEFGRALDLDVSNPLTEGIMGVIEGEAPTGSDEVALSPQYVEDLGASIGDTVELQVGEATAESRLVGIVSPPFFTNQYWLVASPAGLEQLVTGPEYTETFVLVGGPGAEEAGDRLLQDWQREGKYEFWPDSAVVPRPPELEFVEDNLYLLLDRHQVDELVEMAGSSAEFQETGYDPAIHEQAMAMVEEAGLTYDPRYPPAVDLYVEYRQDRLQGLALEGNSSLVSTALAAMLLVEVAFVAGAAFAAGTRRRLREIGLLGANGASVKHIRATVLGEGLAVGLIGALVGTALGVAVLQLARPLIQRYVTRLITGPGVSFLDVAGPVLVAVVAVVISAWFPGRTASKVPITTALQGRMPALAPRKWVVPVGVAMATVGTLLVVVSLASNSAVANVLVGAGAVTMVSGAALLASPILALASRLADRVPAASRLVLRDSGRHRTRSAVAVAATMVILLAPVIALTTMAMSARQQLIYGLPEPSNQLLLMGSYETLEDSFFAPGMAPIGEEDVERVASIVPETTVAHFDAVDIEVGLAPHFDLITEDGGFFGDDTAREAAIANPDLVAALNAPGLGEALAAGKLVVLGLEERSTQVMVDGRELAATELPVPVVQFAMPRLLIPQSRANEFSEASRWPQALFLLERGLSDEREELYDGGLEIRESHRGISLSQLYLIVCGVTLLAVLIVVALVTAVSAAETDEEIRTIVAVGAPGSIRRRFLGLLTGYQTLVAMALAIPLGLLLVKVFSSANTYFQSGPFGQVSSSLMVVPIWPLAGLAVGLPLLIGSLTLLAVRSAPVTPPRRPT